MIVLNWRVQVVEIGVEFHIGMQLENIEKQLGNSVDNV